MNYLGCQGKRELFPSDKDSITWPALGTVRQGKTVRISQGWLSIREAQPGEKHNFKKTFNRSTLLGNAKMCFLRPALAHGSPSSPALSLLPPKGALYQVSEHRGSLEFLTPEISPIHGASVISKFGKAADDVLQLKTHNSY